MKLKIVKSRRILIMFPGEKLACNTCMKPLDDNNYRYFKGEKVYCFPCASKQDHSLARDNIPIVKVDEVERE